MFRFGWVAHEKVPFDIIGWVANDNSLDQSDIIGRELGWVAPIVALPPATRGRHPPTALPSIAPKPHKVRCSRTPKPLFSLRNLACAMFCLHYGTAERRG